MYDSDLFMFRNASGLVCCETLSGDRFRIKKIQAKNNDSIAVFTDGTTAKAGMIYSIEVFDDVRKAQSFLLKK